jgi:putative ABC transport system permease protein
VRRFWPAESPIGRRVKIDTAPGSAAAEPWMMVVGVVGDVRFSPGREPMPTIYMAHAQQPWPVMMIAVKTSIASASIAQAARGAVRAMNPDMVVRSFVLSDRIQQDQTMVRRRFVTQLLGALAAIAMVMALLGIYGLLAYTVAQRTHEIGIRIALGASRLSVIRGVMRQGMLMAAMGLAGGCVSTVVAIRTIRAMLVVSPTDPITLAAVAALVLLVVAAASFVPARRATKIDPMLALHSE